MICSWQIISHEIVFNYLSKLCAVRNFVENELNRMGHIWVRTKLTLCIQMQAVWTPELFKRFMTEANAGSLAIKGVNAHCLSCLNSSFQQHVSWFHYTSRVVWIWELKEIVPHQTTRQRPHMRLRAGLNMSVDAWPRRCERTLRVWSNVVPFWEVDV